MIKDFLSFALSIFTEFGKEIVSIFFDVVKLNLNSFPINSQFSIIKPFLDYWFLFTDIKKIIFSIEDLLVEQDSNTNIDFCYDLIFVWEKLGDLQKAQLFIRKLLDLSFGIGWRKDYQMEWWSRWLRKYIDSNPRNSEETIIKFVQYLKISNDKSEGHGIFEASEDVLKAAYHYSPQFALKLFISMKNENLIGHFRGMAALIEQAVDESNCPFNSILNYIIEIFLPLSEHAFPRMLQKIILKLWKLAKIDKVIIQKMIDQIEIYSLSLERERWLLGCAYALKKIDILGEFSLNIKSLKEKIVSSSSNRSYEDLEISDISDYLKAYEEDLDHNLYRNIKYLNYLEIEVLSLEKRQKVRQILNRELSHEISQEYVMYHDILWRLDSIIFLLEKENYAIGNFWQEIENYLDVMFQNYDLNNYKLQLIDKPFLTLDDDIFLYLTIWGLELPVMDFYFNSMKASIILLNEENQGFSELIKNIFIHQPQLQKRILVILNAVENRKYIKDTFFEFLNQNFTELSYFSHYLISILKQELVPQIDILDSIGELEENISESFLMKADETERQRLIKEGLEFRFLQSTILAKMAIYENFLSKNDNQTFNLWKNYQQSEIFYDFFNFHIFTNKIQKKPSFINYSEKSYRISEETCNQVEICQIPPKFDNFYIIAIQYYILYHQYQGRRFEKRVLSYRTIKKDDLKKSSQYELSDNNEDYIISLHENNCFKYILPCPEFCLLQMNPSTCKQFGWIQDANDQKLWRNKKGKIMVKTYSWQDGLMDYGHLYETYTSNGTMILIAEEAMKNIYGGADILIEFQDIIHRSAQNLTLSKSFQKKCSLDF